MFTVNVASHLAMMATSSPDRVAVCAPHARGRKSLTFRELHEESDALAHGLGHLGIGAQSRVALMVPPTLEFFTLAFALFKLAAVPVMIDPGMGVKNVGTCLREAEPQAFVGIPKAHVARRLFGWAKRSLRTTVNVGAGRFYCHQSVRELIDEGKSAGPFASPPVSPDDMAAILFTSGSTGIAKGAVYTHGIFSQQVEVLKSTYGIQPGEIDLCTFPLFALFGPALGMTCIIPDMNPARPATIDAAKTIATIEQFGVTNLFGSPAVIRRLGDYASRNPSKSLPTLRRVLSAGAPASAPVIERFVNLLAPGVQLFTPYGATESLPVANIGSDEILSETRHLTDAGHGICVGRPVAGMTVRIIGIRDDAIAEWNDALCVPPGTIGEIVVRGPVVTKAYFRREDATKLAKIIDPHTGEILHRMGDVGYFDTSGRLWFCGRKSHRVETPYGALFTDKIEPMFNSVEGVFRTALVGIKRHGTTYPAICVDTPVRGWAWVQLEAALRERALAIDPVNPIVAFLRYPGFPVDVRHNSKIFREKLAVWASRKLGRTWKGTPV